MAPKLVSNRKLIGVGILIAIAGAFFSMITGLFPGLGGGSGEGEGTDPDNVSVNSSAETPTTETVPDAKTLDTNGLMDIVIDGDKYLVQQSNGTRLELSLDDVVKRAPQMPGNADGIRVQISRKRSSIFAAENNLKEKLLEAGLEEGELDWVQETVE